MKVTKNETGRKEAGIGEPVFAGALLTGQVSRSNETAKVHRLYRDGHATQAEFKAATEKDMRQIFAAQRSFAFASYGQLDWLDALRPLTTCFSGFAVRESAGEDSVGPVTRWFRTDTFYRKPLVKAKIDCSGGELARIMPDASADAVLFLPSPYTFVRLVENTFYENDAALANDYAKSIAKSSRKLLEKGYKCILLAEPFVGYAQSKGEHGLPDWFATSLSEVKEDGMVVGISFPLAEVGDAMKAVERTNLDFVGIDATFASSFKLTTSKDLLIGVVDGSRPIVESAATIKKRVKSVLSEAKFSGRYYIGPNDRLWDVPFETGLKKIEALGTYKGAEE